MRNSKQVAPFLLVIVLLCAVVLFIYPESPLYWEDLSLDIDLPFHPGEPDEPNEPDEPTTPTDPVTPNDPTTPSNPTTPNDPTTPGDPTTPTDPVTPDDPTTPQDPSTPGTTPNPSTGYTFPIDMTPYNAAIHTQNLLLVNKKTPLGATYVPPSVVTLDYNMTNGRKLVELETTAALALEAMWKCMQADGITDTYVTSGYRSYAKQLELQTYYQQIELKNHPELKPLEVLEIVHTYSAPPGKSEHQSGLCVDFITSGMNNDLNATFANYPAFAWLQQNARYFGFILRYPEDKVSITQYTYEPWHYRFVGREAAMAITEQGITLEEYLANQ